MILKESFQNALLQTEDEYQLIAVCYTELLSYHEDSDAVFLAKMGNLRQDFCSYAGQFEDLRQNFIILAGQMDVDTESDGISFEMFRQKFLQLLHQFSCPKELAENICMPICIFLVLEAIDFYLQKHLENIYPDLQSCGPLNEGPSQNDCLVYLHERDSFLHDCYISDNREDNFRAPHGPVRIGSIFHRFLLIRRTDPKRIPKIVPIPLNNAWKKEIKDKKMLRIASIPFAGFDTFYFHELNKENPCQPGRTPRGPFYVEYAEAWEESNSRQIVSLLKTAVRQGAHIVIFPEFIMSAMTVKSLQDCLRRLDSSSKRQLLFVLAGTCYHWDGKSEGNNILHILSADGIEIGCYYKYSPFLQQAEEQVHGAQLSSAKTAEGLEETAVPRPRQYLKNCEILSHPGKECTLLDVEGVGRIQLAICRDVIDGVLTNAVAKLFMPSMLMIPAWSRSVGSFDSHCEDLAKIIHTASLLCNCCNAVKAKEDENEKAIGKFFIPTKKQTQMASDSIPVNRTKDCLALCHQRGGCVFQMVLDFSEGQPVCRGASQSFPPEEPIGVTPLSDGHERS